MTRERSGGEDQWLKARWAEAVAVAVACGVVDERESVALEAMGRLRPRLASLPAHTWTAELALEVKRIALGRHFERYHRDLWLVARGIVRNSEDAEDVIQDAFGHLMARGWKLEREGHIVPFLKQNVMYAALELLRRRRAARRPDTRSSPYDPERHGEIADRTATSVEEAADLLQRKRAVWDAILQLPPEEMQVILLRYFAVKGRPALTQQEAADVLGMSRDQVRAREERAKAEMRRLLEALEEE